MNRKQKSARCVLGASWAEDRGDVLSRAAFLRQGCEHRHEASCAGQLLDRRDMIAMMERLMTP